MGARRRNLLPWSVLLLVLTVASNAQSVDRPVWIALFPGDLEPILRNAPVPIWGREEGVVIAGPSSDQLDVLRAQSIEPIFSAPDNGEGIQVLSHDSYFTPPAIPGLVRFQINDRAMLYLIPAGPAREPARPGVFSRPQHGQDKPSPP